VQNKLVTVYTVGAMKKVLDKPKPLRYCEIFFFFRSGGNRGYLLKLGSSVLPVYCHMTNDLGACGGGGWTLVMKIDGNQVRTNKLF